MNRELLPNGPGRDSVVRRVADLMGVRPHPLAVKRRQQQPALSQMLRAIQKKRRSRAHERAQRTVGLARMKRVGVTENNLAHRRRVAGEDERRDVRHTDREPIAVAPRASVEKPKRIAHEIESREEARTRRQRGRRHGASVTTRGEWGEEELY